MADATLTFYAALTLPTQQFVSAFPSDNATASNIGNITDCPKTSCATVSASPAIVSTGYFEIPWYVKATNIITLQGDDVIDYRVPTELSILLCFLVDLSNGFTVLLGQPLRGS